MKIAFAALLSLLMAAPALAGSTSAIHVELVVTGGLASPLAGTWDSRSAARGTIYHFAVSGSSGVFYKLVSVPLREPLQVAAADSPSAGAAAQMCDLRVSGVIYSLDPTSGRTGPGSSYEMRYSIQSAQAVTSSTRFDDCKEVAASYVSSSSAADAPHSLILSRTGKGRLIDSATGQEYIRTAD